MSEDSVPGPDNLALSRKEDFKAFAESPRRIQPDLLTRSQLKSLAMQARADYDRRRRKWHANIGPIKTPQLADLHEDLWDIVDSNEHDGDKAKGAVAVDAFPGLGKTTSVLAFARDFHQREIEESGLFTSQGHERIPVCRVGLTGNTGMKDLNRAMLEFFGHPGQGRGTTAQFGRRVLDCVLSCDVRLVVLDDLHFLKWGQNSGIEVSNHLKWIANEFPVTLLMVGVELAEKGLFGEGANGRDTALAQTGRRTTRLGLRPFTIEAEAGRREWRHMLLALEQRLVLTEKHPGMLADDLSDYLFARSTGHIGSLMTLINRGCQRAVRTGVERLDQELMDRVKNDEASEAARLELQAALERRRLTSRPPLSLAVGDSRVNTRVRTLPIRVPSLPGEALDSWTEALARRLDSPLGEVLHHLGLPPRTGYGDHLRGIPPDWTIMLSGANATNIVHASGLDERTVTDMTLMYYDGRAVRINTERGNVNRRVLWGRGSGSRFCPDCLIESGGRWLLSWRLGCSFACFHHGRLLADCCPVCNQIPRERPAATPAIPWPHTCGSPYPGPGGGFSKGCGFDLTQTRTLRLPASHPALLAQARLLDVIDADTAAFGAYQYSPQSARQALTDIQAIARRVLQDLPASDLRDLVPRDIADGHLITAPGCPLASRAAERPGFMAPPRAVSTAASVAVALHVLEQPDIHRAGRVLRDLIEAMREELWQVSITSIDGWGRDLSTVLNAVHLAALAPSMRPNEQLRHRTSTAMPRRTEKTSRDTDRRARKIPSMFWPVWTARLTPPEGVYPRAIAPALAASLLIVGSKARLEDVAERLGSATNGINVSRILQGLQDQPQWTDTVVALVRLADHLDATEVPIDYQRRRRLDHTRLLPRSRWSQICRSTGTPVGRGPREQIVRSLLFQRVSGLPAEVFPRHQNVTEAEFRQQTAYFAALQTPELADALAGEARLFLAENRIDSEPITWQPPATLLSGLNLPGSDPDHIDVSRLHQLVRQHKRPVQHAARVLDTSIAAIRYVLDEHPAPAAELTERSARSTVQIRQRARREVPKEVLTRLYLDERHSLQAIADMTGFSRGLLTDLAREYDIPIAGFQGRQPRVTIERAWLFEQYVVRRRPLPDLAREQGMSRSNMARWARVHNIPLRRSGGASHHAALRTTELAVRLPAILRNALTSPFAWQRMRNFAAASAFPSMHEAARALSINRSTLVNQINQLEGDLGQPLLERATRGRAMKLTSFGKRVIAAINKIPSEEGVHRALTAPDWRPS